MCSPETPCECKTTPTQGQETIPVIYGLPTFELFAAAEAGKVILGGCTPPHIPLTTDDETIQ